MPENLLQVVDLQWTAPDGKQVLSGASFAVDTGELVWLSGPSGGGKSTLLRLLNRLISPAAGRVLLFGEPIELMEPWTLRRKVLLVSQTPAVLGDTIRQNLEVAFSFRAAKDQNKPDTRRMQELLDYLGLGGLGLDREIKGLSVGQLQRMCLARAILLNPLVLLLDEPLAPLDPDAAELVLDTLGAFTAGGGAVVMVSHQQPANGPRKLVLRDGRVEEGS